ncbi:MAG: 6-phosphofructokinase [Gloeomargaritaceae cyanobacterium C42_A2020_066]|nr:6-phosphofructokinase [Gloeomargaritaceae cyanobacterium C42_A2020_066]
MRRIGVLTSGGDAPGMNAAIRAVVRGSTAYGVEVIGIRHGYAGLISGDFVPLGPRDVANTIQRGGTVLLSARSLDFYTPAGRAQAAANAHAAGIEGLVAIGGDGTYQGAWRLWEEHQIPVICAPGTIDNDLCGTDETIGFDTAVNVATEAIDRIRDTAASHERVFFIEVMGRHTGFIALAVGIAGGAEVIALPERVPQPEQVARTIRDAQARGKLSAIVVVAEGAFPGGAQALMQAVHPLLGVKSWVTILGHIQRGGSPTAKDRVLASRLGTAAVEALLDGKAGLAVGVVNHQIHFTPLEIAACSCKLIDPHLVTLAQVLAL